MKMVTIQLSPNPNPTQSLTIENNQNTQLRDASFSSYLNNTEESFVLKLAGSTQTMRDDHVIWAIKKAKDTEIGVFGAERYFNEEMHHDKKKYHVKKDEHVGLALYPFKPIVPSVGTPSVRSESSMNSQSMLLKRNLAGSKANKVHGKSFFSTIGCKCVCSDKNSVDIDEYACGVNKLDKAGNNCGSIHRLDKMPIQTSFDIAEITKPLSQSWAMNEKVNHNKHAHIRSNSNGLTIVQFPSANINNGDESDDQSDASSDLFEIESLTGKANPNLSRQTSEGLMSGCATPANGYAPSEASIEWSVVTASVADFSLDQFRSANFTKTDSKSFGSVIGNNVMNKELNRRRSGNFMSCKSHKAVRVARDEYRTRLPHKPAQEARGNLPQGSHMLFI